MSDQKPSDQPSPDPAGNVDGGMLSEQELDEALADASLLADDLSEQVGIEKREDVGKLDAEATADSDKTLTEKLDAELGELERLIATAGNELDAASERPEEPGASDEDSATPPDDPASSKPQDTIPDFMAEFTRPEQPIEPAPRHPEPTAPDSQENACLGEGQDTPTPPAGARKPGVVGTGTMGVVGAPGTTILEDLWKDDQPADEEPEQYEEPPQGKVLPGLNDAVRATAARLSPLAMSVCDRVVTGLEVIDRPVSKLGHPVRRWVGWLAIATAATSVIVYLYSLV